MDLENSQTQFSNLLNVIVHKSFHLCVPVSLPMKHGTFLPPIRVTNNASYHLVSPWFWNCADFILVLPVLTLTTQRLRERYYYSHLKDKKTMLEKISQTAQDHTFFNKWQNQESIQVLWTPKYMFLITNKLTCILTVRTELNAHIRYP